VDSARIDDAARSALAEVRELLTASGAALGDPDHAAAGIVEAVANRIKERVSNEITSPESP